MNGMRRHFVFIARCGCPTGLVEQSQECLTADDAWDEMYETRAQERHARTMGVRVELVDHPTYTREFYPLMTKECTH